VLSPLCRDKMLGALIKVGWDYTGNRCLVDYTDVPNGLHRFVDDYRFRWAAGWCHVNHILDDSTINRIARPTSCSSVVPPF
jgi:hypothetical protein